MLFFFLFLLIQVACVENTSESQSKEENTARPWKLICLGDDWTVGAGLEPEQAYPALLARQLSVLQPVKVVNAGIKGELVSGAADRVDWILQQRLDALLIHYRLTNTEKEPLSVKELEDWKRLLNKVRLAYPELPVLVASGGVLSSKEDLPQGLAMLFEQFAAQWVAINIPAQARAPQYWQRNGELLSEEGQKVVAEQLFSIVSPLVNALPQ
jgi:acyl-CoA thioesterase-1